MTREQMITEITNATEPFTPSMDFLDDDSLKALYEKEVGSTKNGRISIWDILVDVVRTIGHSDYKDDIVFRGAFVLVSHLRAFGINTDRLTEDIDMDWKSTDKWKEFHDDLPTLLTSASSLGLRYSYDESSGDFSLEKMKLVLVAEKKDFVRTFALDLSHRDILNVMELNIADTAVNAGDLYISLCDKLNVFATQRIGARIKDFYDIYLISHYDTINLIILVKCWRDAGYALPEIIFGLSPQNFGRMKKPFEIHSKMRFDNTVFEDIMARVVDFTTNIFIAMRTSKSYGVIWNADKGVWEDEK